MKLIEVDVDDSNDECDVHEVDVDDVNDERDVREVDVDDGRCRGCRRCVDEVKR